MSELGPDAREILRNGRDGDNPSPADRARIHGALMAVIAAGAATTMANQASASTTNLAPELEVPTSIGAGKPIAAALSGSIFAKGMLVVVLGAAGAGAWMAWPAPPTRSIVSASNMPDKPVVSGPETPVPALPASSVEVAPEKPAEPLVEVSEQVISAKPEPARAPASGTAPKVVEETADSLLAETQRLREAHGALREGDPEKALALLSEQAAEDEGQKLREERAAARVLALCKLGRVDEARAEAEAFLNQNPRSPLADRVRKACPRSP